MSFHVPANQTVCWTIYWQSIVHDKEMSDRGYSFADCEQFQQHAMRAFNNGEPIWMAAAEIRQRIDICGTVDRAYRKEKTPMQLARRFVRV